MSRQEQIAARPQSGFTLLELLMAGAMVATLAMLSIPAYQNHVLRSHRALAKTTLVDLASRQEAYALHQHAYANDLGVLLGHDLANEKNFYLNRDAQKTTVIHGNSIYEFKLLNASATSFDLSATAIGAQASDQHCQSLSLNSKGQRAATARQAADSRDCWR